MARGINRVILVGNVGTDPALKRTENGTAVCKFRLATSENFGLGEDAKEHTEWHTITAWGKLGELCEQHLSKGHRAYIEGAIRNSQWTTADGQKRNSTEIRARDVVFLSPAKTSHSSKTDIPF